MQDLNRPHYCWYHHSFTFHMRCISIVTYLYYYYNYNYCCYYSIIIIIIIMLHKISLLCLTTHSVTWIEYAVELHVWLVG